MSIQSEIDRISGAVSDAFAAVSGKGVTVPDGTKVTGLAELIAAIEAGGGVDGYVMFSGSIIVSETPTASIKITHDNTGATWNDVVIFFEDIENKAFTSSGIHIAAIIQFPSVSKSVVQYDSTSSRGYGSNFSISNGSFTLDEDVYKKMNPGVKYTWIRLHFGG